MFFKHHNVEKCNFFLTVTSTISTITIKLNSDIVFDYVTLCVYKYAVLEWLKLRSKALKKNHS